MMVLQLSAAFSPSPSENKAFKGTSASHRLQGAPDTVCQAFPESLNTGGKKKGNLKLYMNTMWAEHVQFPGLCLAGKGNNKMSKYLGSLSWALDECAGYPGSRAGLCWKTDNREVDFDSYFWYIKLQSVSWTPVFFSLLPQTWCLLFVIKRKTNPTKGRTCILCKIPSVFSLWFHDSLFCIRSLSSFYLVKLSPSSLRLCINKICL